MIAPRCFLALLVLVCTSFAQTETPTAPAATTAPAAPAPKPWVSPAPTVPIWPEGKMPGKGASAPESEVVRTDGFHRLTNVSNPTLTLFPAPRKGGATGAAPAMIVCPGGGYGYTVIDKEGTEIATWLNSAGISALVLKYRTPNNRAGALQDAQRALSLARARAAEWNVDPKRLGIIGFSAGGNLAAKTSAPLEERSYPAIDDIDRQSCRPDFAVLVYPAYLDDKAGNVAPDLNMKAQFPPLLIVHNEDDKTHVVGSKVFDAALTEAKIAHEFKLYPTGGHGYGLHCTGDAKAWTDDALQWLQKVTSATGAAATESPWDTGKFRWTSSGPLIDVEAQRALEDPHVALKDPAVVFRDGRWHVFATLRMKSGRVCMQYFNFTDWAQANAAPRETLSFTGEYHCAPQVFYFAPHHRWYLIYQLVDPAQKPPMGPYFSTTENIADPKSWTKPALMVTNPAPGQKWIDFWVICDAEKSHLFYTSNNGKMWRRETKLADFPYGWSDQVLALEGDIFEASHTYKLQNREQYLTIIEAQAPGRRYYKAYLADRLDGPWKGLADSLAKPFAAMENVLVPFVGEVLVPDSASGPVTVQPPLPPAWTTSVSHGELLRTGVDERMEVDPDHLQFLYQGVSEADYRGSKYGGIPWRLGLLKMER